MVQCCGRVRSGTAAVGLVAALVVLLFGVVGSRNASGKKESLLKEICNAVVTLAALFCDRIPPKSKFIERFLKLEKY